MDKHLDEKLDCIFGMLELSYLSQPCKNSVVENLIKEYHKINEVVYKNG